MFDRRTRIKGTIRDRNGPERYYDFIIEPYDEGRTLNVINPLDPFEEIVRKLDKARRSWVLAESIGCPTQEALESAAEFGLPVSFRYERAFRYVYPSAVHEARAYAYRGSHGAYVDTLEPIRLLEHHERNMNVSAVQPRRFSIEKISELAVWSY